MWLEPLDFSRRAQLSEWMDEPCDYSTFRDCLLDLEKLNRTVGAYHATERWLQQFVGSGSAPFHIVDVGCGGGGLLRRLELWGQSRGLQLTLTGIDLNPFATQAAREFTGGNSSIEFLTGDAFSYQPPSPIDLVISSLFTHHLCDEEVVRFLMWMEKVSGKGWFINDLHRRRLPYYGFKLLAWSRQWHSFVRHDGPLSFRRSFLKKDWVRFVSDAGLAVKNVKMDAGQLGRLCVSRVK